MPSALIAVVVVVVAVLVATRFRGVRARTMVSHPRLAARVARISDGTAPLLLGVALALLAVAVAVRGQAGLVLGAVVLGLLTGTPSALEARAVRRRLRDAPPAADPLPLGPGPGSDSPAGVALARADPLAALAALGPLGPDPDLADLRPRAVAAAAIGDARVATACALRAVQLDPLMHGVATDAGLLLCRRGRVAAGLRLLERSTSLAPDEMRPRLALVEGLRLAGRPRDAVAVLERRPGAPGYSAASR